MKKLILIILIAFSFGADLSWLKGDNNPNGKTGMLTFKPRHNMLLNDAPYSNHISISKLTLSVTDYFTVERTQAHIWSTGNREWDTLGEQMTELYIHIPVYKLWE